MENENHLSPEFLSFYRDKVQPVAEKCTPFFPLMVSIEDKGHIPTSLEKKNLENVIDLNACWYIGLMMSDINRYAIKGIRLTLINSLSTVQGCLNSESYWTNVWKDDVSTDEAKNLKELAGLMNELIKKL